MSISLLREHIREMLRVIMEVEGSGGSDAGSGGVGDTHPNAPQGSGTGTTGTKSTTKTGKKPPAGTNTSVMNRVGRAADSQVVKKIGDAFKGLKGPGAAATAVAVGDAMQDAVISNGAAAAEKAGQTPTKINPRMIAAFQRKSTAQQLAVALKAEKESKALNNDLNVSPNDSPDKKIEKTAKDSFEAVTGKKPKA